LILVHPFCRDNEEHLNCKSGNFSGEAKNVATTVSRAAQAGVLVIFFFDNADSNGEVGHNVFYQILYEKSHRVI